MPFAEKSLFGKETEHDSYRESDSENMYGRCEVHEYEINVQKIIMRYPPSLSEYSPVNQLLRELIEHNNPVTAKLLKEITPD